MLKKNKKNYAIRLIFDKKISTFRKWYYCGFSNAFEVPHPEKRNSPLVFMCTSDSDDKSIAVFSSLSEVKDEIEALRVLIKIDESFKRPGTIFLPPTIKIMKTKLSAKPFDFHNLVKNAQGIIKGMKDWYDQYVK